jgi:hypothetical protein
MIESQHRFRDSIRVVAELLAVACIGWLASTVTTQTTAIAVLTSDVRQLHDSLQGIPTMSEQIATMRVQINEHDRRINALEQETRTKGWTR